MTLEEITVSSTSSDSGQPVNPTQALVSYKVFTKLQSIFKNYRVLKSRITMNLLLFHQLIELRKEIAFNQKNFIDK